MRYCATPRRHADRAVYAQQASSLPSRIRHTHRTTWVLLATRSIGGFRLSLNPPIMRHTDEGRAQWELAHIAEAKESVEKRSDEHTDEGLPPVARYVGNT